jgi:hypothetical protein
MMLKRNAGLLSAARGYSGEQIARVDPDETLGYIIMLCRLSTISMNLIDRTYSWRPGRFHGGLDCRGSILRCLVR